MLYFLKLAKFRIVECFDLKSIREKVAKNKELQKKKEKKDFRTELIEVRNAAFFDQLEKLKLLIVACLGVWCANLINFLSFFTNYGKITDIAFWIVSASFFMIPANTVISLLLALIVIISVATAKLKKKMETTGIYITNRKLGLILKNYYFGWFCMAFFTTFIMSQAIHSINTVHWLPVVLLIIQYNLFILMYSLIGTCMLLFFDYILTKFSDYIIDNIEPPQEITR
ncbi:MAG: hypothetical protein EKK54_11055 [Neisseriaceae bacterium]|nr:MAG: hypothetical protein EKK54_11055 [Neisseriaceae bacterium]